MDMDPHAEIKKYNWKNKGWVVILFVILSMLPFQPVSANPARQTEPTDFTLELSAPGVRLYRKDYPNGSPDYVQVVDLSEGASLLLLHGEVTSSDSRGAYDGDNPEFQRQSLQEVWDEVSGKHANTFCLTNGQFFSTNDDPTQLAYPLKTGGKIISEGTGVNEFPFQKLILELWGDRAAINPLSQEALQGSNAPQILAGLAEDVPIEPDNATGRTFSAILDKNGDGEAEVVLLYTTRTAVQADAAAVLYSFGASQVMMLDGGSSSQLICKGAYLVNSVTTLPQTIAVLSYAEPLSSKVVRQSDWVVLVEGENAEVEVMLQNTGSTVWGADGYALVNLKNPFGAASRLPLQVNVDSGDQARFAWKTERFAQWGVYVSEWQLARGGEILTGAPVKVNIIVLPKALENQRKIMETQIKTWLSEKVNNIEGLISGWIQDNTRTVVNEWFKIPEGSWVPMVPWMLASLLLTPVVLGLVKAKFRRKKRKGFTRQAS